MSTATLAAPTAGRDARPGIGRLTAVELRKMTDTRAGFWLLLGTVGLVVAGVTLLAVFGKSEDHALLDFVEVAVAPIAVVLPIAGILLVSSEWSQRTSLLTFTLVPRRSRVLAAKLAAAVVLSLGALQVCLAIALLGTAAVDGSWALPAGILGQTAILVVTSMITGVAFGAVFLASPPAIVLYFALPLAWAALGSLAFLEGAARWLDGARSLDPMTSELMSVVQWERAGATLALWMLLPLLIGLWRVTRGDVR
jgi:ABC-2 type transport system permease protein